MRKIFTSVKGAMVGFTGAVVVFTVSGANLPPIGAIAAVIFGAGMSHPYGSVTQKRLQSTPSKLKKIEQEP